MYAQAEHHYHRSPGSSADGTAAATSQPATNNNNSANADPSATAGAGAFGSPAPASSAKENMENRQRLQLDQQQVSSIGVAGLYNQLIPVFIVLVCRCAIIGRYFSAGRSVSDWDDDGRATCMISGGSLAYIPIGVVSARLCFLRTAFAVSAVKFELPSTRSTGSGRRSVGHCVDQLVGTSGRVLCR